MSFLKNFLISTALELSFIRKKSCSLSFSMRFEWQFGIELPKGCSFKGCVGENVNRNFGKVTVDQSDTEFSVFY